MVLSDQWSLGIKSEDFMFTQNFYKNNKGKNTFEFTTKDPLEIVLWVMSLGKGVEILEPWDLRARVKQLAEDVSGNYKAKASR